MKKILPIIGFMLLLFGCRKDINNAPPAETSNEDSYFTTVQRQLKDSLSREVYASVNFTAFLKTFNSQNHKTYVRIGITNKEFANDFVLLQIDSVGNIIKGRIVHVSKDSIASSKHNEFNGSLVVTSLSNRPLSQNKILDGKLIKPGKENLKAEDPDGAAGTQDLAPVVVTAYTNSGINYADWYLLSAMVDDYSSGDYWYSPATSSGGGGGSSGSAATQVDFEAPESKEAIDISKYIKCFGATQDANATYTVTICADLPVDADPSKFFNWSDASPGHTFIELYKNGSGGLVQQNLGFYPNTSWKTVAGPDNIASKIADDAGHEYQARYTIAVNATQFQQALSAAARYSTHDYNIAEFNCADFALDIFKAAGGTLNVPQFQIPGFPSSDGSNTPEGVYDAIANLALAGNNSATANGQKQWTGNSHGACE